MQTPPINNRARSCNMGDGGGGHKEGFESQFPDWLSTRLLAVAVIRRQFLAGTNL